MRLGFFIKGVNGKFGKPGRTAMTTGTGLLAFCRARRVGGGSGLNVSVGAYLALASIKLRRSAFFESFGGKVAPCIPVLDVDEGKLPAFSWLDG